MKEKGIAAVKAVSRISSESQTNLTTKGNLSLCLHCYKCIVSIQQHLKRRVGVVILEKESKNLFFSLW